MCYDMGNRTKEVRTFVGLSQREVARRVGISPTGYNAIERGLHTPNVLTGIRIARTLGTTVEALWGDADG